MSFLVVDLSLYKTTQIEVLKHLAKRDYKVELLAVYSRDKCAIGNYNIHTILIPLRYIPVITPFLFAIITTIFSPFYIAIKRPKFIIVEPDLTTLVFVWKPILSILGIKIVLDIRSTPVDFMNFREYLSALWFKVSVVIGKNMFDGITTLTQSMKQELCDNFKISPDFIGVWTSGVSLTLFDPSKYSNLHMREKLCLSNKFVVMYHGSISVNRGIIESIKAIEIVKNEYPDIAFFILGRGHGEVMMKKLIRELELQRHVIFHKSVPYREVPKFIAISDIALIPLPDLPIWRNQCPLKLLEYLAMKKVVIATDIPAHREVIGNCKCGIYISSAKPDQIASAIIYAYNNKRLIKKWGSYGRNIIVKKRYCWEKIAEDFDAYLSRLINSKNEGAKYRL